MTDFEVKYHPDDMWPDISIDCHGKSSRSGRMMVVIMSICSSRDEHELLMVFML